MKKKSRILAFVLCLLCLFCWGCSDRSLKKDLDQDLEDIEEEIGQLTSGDNVDMDGVKVLAKPSNYDFAAAVGENLTENYYNLFAYEILRGLYGIYETPSNVSENIYEDYVGDLITNNGITYPGSRTDLMTGTNSDNYYYLYDSIRYTITDVDDYYDTDGTSYLGSIITLDTSKSWNWKINYDADSAKIIFLTYPENVSNYEVSNNKLVFDYREYFDYNWQAIYTENLGSIPNFQTSYAKDDRSGVASGGNLKNRYSPYYDNHGGDKIDGTAAINYYQDALEYVIYLLVLGYDFNNPEDKDYFDFVMSFENGLVSDIKVKGWGPNPISISKDEGDEPCALSRVKAIYKELGNFVGITSKNREDIQNFILNYVIGEKALDTDEKDKENGVFTVKRRKYTRQGPGENDFDRKETADDKIDDLKFNRNYKKIIENIVSYACSQAIIGQSEGAPVYLSTPYMASTITDYMRDYFGANYVDKDGNNTDDATFDYIEAAEYQSIVIYPKESLIKERLEKGWPFNLVDLHLMFEYYDCPEGLKNIPEGLEIYVGLRYYDHTQKKYIVGGDDKKVEKKVVLKPGKFPEPFDKNTDIDSEEGKAWQDNYEAHTLYFTDTGVPDEDLAMGEVPIKGAFNRNIGNDAINPFVQYIDDSSYIEDAQARMLIGGNTNARQYYKIMESSSKCGFYGVLNEEQFNGDDGCDFLEIYFDIVKQKGVLGNNYNFKVCITEMLGTPPPEED